jgi:hypothetical protein
MEPRSGGAFPTAHEGKIQVFLQIVAA